MDTVERFFEHFERLSREADVPSLVELFAPTFIVGNPSGSQVVSAAMLQLAIPKRQKLFESLGCISTQLVAVRPTALDPRFSVVRTEWRWVFERGVAPAVEVTLSSTYLVERVEQRFQILAYINHGDILDVLRTHGINAN